MVRCRTESALPTFKLDRRGPVTPRRAPCAATPVNARPALTRVYSADDARGEAVMDLPFGGGCAFGAIRYECAGAPRCHCTDCQQATGSAFLPAVMVKESGSPCSAASRSGSRDPRTGDTPCAAPSAPHAARRCSWSTERTRRFGCSMRAAWTTRAGTGRAGRSMWRARSLGVSCTLTSPMTRVCRGDSRPICR